MAATSPHLRHAGKLALALALVVFAAVCPHAPALAASRRPSAKPAGPRLAPSTADDEVRSRVESAIGAMPVSFEANAGQADRRVKFVARGAGGTVLLTAAGSEVYLAGPAGGAVIRMTLAGARGDAVVEGLEPLGAKTNYLRGNDPQKWKTGVTSYAKVRYNGVYRGVDLVYYGNDRHEFEYDFAVAPGADPRAIRLDFDGAEKVEVDATGDLVLHTVAGDVRHRKPVVYQEVGGARREVPSRYVLLGKRQVGFDVGRYDAAKPLVVDPTVLYSSYLSGSDGRSEAAEVAIYTDAATGKVYAYIVGHTDASDFPTVNAIQPEGIGYHGNRDVVVAKFDMTATGAASVVYSTYLGGGGSDVGLAVAVDPAGHAFVAGRTDSPGWPVVQGLSPAGSVGSFVAELAVDGSGLVYSTVFTGADIRALAVDSAGNAYATGPGGPGFVTTPAAFQPNFPGGAAEVIAKIAPPSGGNPATLVYATFLGTASRALWPWDWEWGGSAVAVDASGWIYVAGRTSSAGFPVVNGFRPTSGGCGGAFFVARLNPFASGAASLVYSTLLGGSDCGIDYIGGLCVDSAGNAYVVGTTGAPDFPVTPGALETTGRGGGGFVAKIDTTQTGADSLVYSTYLGGAGGRSDPTIIDDVAVDSAGNVYVGGGGPIAAFALVDPAVSRPGVVLQTVDGRITFRTTSDGLPESFVTVVAVDTSTVPRTIYAGAIPNGSPGGVYKSTDGGSTWADASPGLATRSVTSLLVDPSRPSTILAVTDGGLLKSVDGGSTWTAAHEGLPYGASTPIAQLVSDASTVPPTIYASVPDGFYKSTDSGNTWSPGLSGVPGDYLAVDTSTSPSTLYTITREPWGSVFRSSDAGSTWEELPVQIPFQHIGILSLEFHVDKLSRPLL